jgi:hypothetical protein
MGSSKVTSRNVRARPPPPPVEVVAAAAAVPAAPAAAGAAACSRSCEMSFKLRLRPVPS